MTAVNDILGAAMILAYPALGLFAIAVLGPGGVRKLARRWRA